VNAAQCSDRRYAELMVKFGGKPKQGGK